MVKFNKILYSIYNQKKAAKIDHRSSLIYFHSTKNLFSRQRSDRFVMLRVSVLNMLLSQLFKTNVFPPRATNLFDYWKKIALSPLMNVALHSTASLTCMQTRRGLISTNICKQRCHCQPEASQQVAAGPAIGQESLPATLKNIACGLWENSTPCW